ncbi:hypothetical protein AKJ40_04115, partial [candidate division MSBL1 archaeon SCGC-AAA259M10]
LPRLPDEIKGLENIRIIEEILFGGTDLKAVAERFKRRRKQIESAPADLKVLTRHEKGYFAPKSEHSLLIYLESHK